MAFAFEELVTRTPVFDRQREILFFRLNMASPAPDAAMPLMLRLMNAEHLNAGYFVPNAWVQDEVIYEKLSRNVVLYLPKADSERAMAAQASSYRVALNAASPDISADFVLQPFGAPIKITSQTVLLGIDTPADLAEALQGPALLFSGNALATATMSSGSKRINPVHALILELINAVRQEAEAKDIELMFKRDIALSFKLLRYINSPGFGLATRVDSIRHALSILGYQQLLKWLTLLAATAGQATPPALTQTAITRARLMELLGTKKLEKREADNLFMTGMLSMLDRIVGIPLTDILANVNLPPSIGEALLHHSGKYRRYLQLALACEGVEIASPEAQPDLDAKTVNVTHLDAMEWAAGINIPE